MKARSPIQPTVARRSSKVLTVEQEQERAADDFNRAHPVGTKVKYWRGARQGDFTGVAPGMGGAQERYDGVRGILRDETLSDAEALDAVKEAAAK